MGQEAQFESQKARIDKEASFLKQIHFLGEFFK